MNMLQIKSSIIFILIIGIIFQVVLFRKFPKKIFQIFHFVGVLSFLFSLVLQSSHFTFFNTVSVIEPLLFLIGYFWFLPGILACLMFILLEIIFIPFDERGKKEFLKLKKEGFLLIIFTLIINLIIIIDYDFILTDYFVQINIFNPIISFTLQFIGCLFFFFIANSLGFKKLFINILGVGILFGMLFITYLTVNSTNLTYQLIANLFLNFLPAPILLSSLIFMIGLMKGVIEFTKYGDSPPLSIKKMNARIQLAAALVLRKELGVITLIKILPKLYKQQKEGEPWNELPEATEIKDIESREEIGDAILIYRILRKLMEQNKALEIVKKMTIKAAIQQLYAIIPQLTKNAIKSIPQEKREEFLSFIIGKFPNTDWHVVQTKENTIIYHITKCRLVELVNEVGYPELSSIFCPGDITYFEKYQKNIKLIRPSTIGEDGKDFCVFQFELNIE